MSEAFDEFLEKRQAEMKQREAAQKWIYIAIGLVLAGVLLFVVLRGDPAKGPVNVNTASKDLLITLPEVGPDLAQKIIANRPYASEKDLDSKVKGIGPKTLEKMRPRLRFADQ